MNIKEEKKERISLSLLLSIVVIGHLVITTVLVGVAVLVLMRLDVLKGQNQTAPTLIVILVAANIVVGTLVTFILIRFPMKPVQMLIDQMNRLASGDYSARLKFGPILKKNSTMVKMADSFNTLAQELENTELLRSDFINNFSHEFKTPIVSIAGFAKVLKRGNLSADQQAEYLDVIEAESLRLSYMATNVLNLTKVENQTILTDVTTFNLSEQLRSSILLLENKWERKNQDFQLYFGEHEIRANEELLKQVWINLIDNAIKFSPEGGVIEVRIEEGEKVVRVAVTNSGPEISPENRKKIFNKFYQADESHASDGNGVGLAIVRQVVRLHKGTVSVESKNARNTFTVELPKGL